MSSRTVSHGARLAVLVALAAAAGACRAVKPRPYMGDPQDGVVEDRVYRNPYFGFTLGIPDGWIVQKRAAMQEYRRAGQKALSRGNPGINEVLSEAERSTVDLLNISTEDPDSINEDSVLVMIVAEKLPEAGRDISAEDYLASSRKIMRAADMRFALRRSGDEMELGGESFTSMELAMDTPGGKVYQATHVLMRRGHALIVNVISARVAGIEKGRAALRSARFR